MKHGLKIMAGLALAMLTGFGAETAWANCGGNPALYNLYHGGGRISRKSSAQIAREARVAKTNKVIAVTEQKELSQLAVKGVDHEVRILAVARLTDKAELQRVYRTSKDVQVRVIVVWKLYGGVIVNDSTPEPIRAAVAAAKAVKEKVVDLGNGVKLVLVWCPPGTFMMGSPTTEKGRDDDEVQHEVTLTQGFWLGKYEVTQAQWQQVMGNNPSKFKGSNNPVEQVSWNDCQKFIAKLNALMKEKGLTKDGIFRLPTEAQWEYACRAGTTTALHNNEELDSTDGFCHHLDEIGWYRENSGSKTHPVGLKLPNAWGLYDMSGNVWEWSNNRYGKYPIGSTTDPTGASSGSYRVGRGGGWYNDARLCRSANRDWITPPSRNRLLGFRITRVVPVKK
jgi:formylglycine-generating enzyme required for sulfatase activity